MPLEQISISYCLCVLADTIACLISFFLNTSNTSINPSYSVAPSSYTLTYLTHLAYVASGSLTFNSSMTFMPG